VKITLSSDFNYRLNNILDFISKDSTSRARKFRSDLMEKINKTAYMPHKHRKSTMANDERIRDLIFKSYVIPFLIDEENDTIEILSIYGRNLP